MSHHKHDKSSGTAFGVDIGGSGIKGAPVSLADGQFAADRVRIPTPQPSTPDAVAKTVAKVVDSFHLDKGVPIGVTFPAVILHGVAQSAANCPSVSDTGAPLIPLPPMSTPKAVSGDFLCLWSLMAGSGSPLRCQ